MLAPPKSEAPLKPDAPPQSATAKPEVPAKSGPRFRVNDLNEEDQHRIQVLAVVMRRPNADRLVQLQTVLAGNLDQPQVQRLLGAFLQNGGQMHFSDQGLSALFDGHGIVRRRPQRRDDNRQAEQKRGQAMGLAVQATLLNDQRPLPKGLVTMEAPSKDEEAGSGSSQPVQVIFAGTFPIWFHDEKITKPKAVRDDWRVCDLAVATAGQQLQWKLNLWQQREAFAFDLNVEPALLDGRIDGIRRIIAVPLGKEMKAAGLPEAAAPPSQVKDENSLF